MLARTWNAGISGPDLIRRALRQSIMRRWIPRASPWNLRPMKHPSAQICRVFRLLFVPVALGVAAQPMAPQFRAAG